MQINRCPKCGREPLIIKVCVKTEDDKFEHIGFEFECYTCCLHSGLCETFEEAVAKWNELTKGEIKWKR